MFLNSHYLWKHQYCHSEKKFGKHCRISLRSDAFTSAALYQANRYIQNSTCKKKNTSLQNDVVYHLGDKCIQPVMGIYIEYLCCCRRTPGHRVGHNVVSSLGQDLVCCLVGGRQKALAPRQLINMANTHFRYLKLTDSVSSSANTFSSCHVLSICLCICHLNHKIT